MSKTSRELDDAPQIRAWELALYDGAVAVVSARRARPLQSELTEAERDIVAGIARGESNRTIAGRRGTSIRTVANQVAAIFQKLGVMSRGELLVWTRRF